MRLAWTLVGLFMLAGCANGLVVRQAELNAWVGRPETELLQAMGAPDRSYQADGMTFLTYEERYVDEVPVAPEYWAMAPSGWGRGFPPRVTVSGCDTTFTVVGGVVRGFSLAGGGCG